MKSIISTLTEKVMLLKNSTGKGNTTVDRFDKVYKARASIRAVNHDLFEVIIPRPPAKLKNAPISAIEWNDAEYVCVSPISEHKRKFLKGKVKLWRSKSKPQQD